MNGLTDYRLEIEEVSAAAVTQGARVRLGLRLVGSPGEIVGELWRIRQVLSERYHVEIFPVTKFPEKGIHGGTEALAELNSADVPWFTLREIVAALEDTWIALPTADVSDRLYELGWRSRLRNGSRPVEYELGTNIPDGWMDVLISAYPSRFAEMFGFPKGWGEGEGEGEVNHGGTEATEDVPVGESELRSAELRSEPPNCDLNCETAI